MLESFVLEQVKDYAEKLEELLDGDIIYYYGPTHQLLIKPFRDLIEKMAADPQKKDKICIFIKTSGGAVEPVEKMVEIVRHHYNTVWFFIPDYAMSAGSIFCMSGDKIFMDYSSSLGPIDPQVLTKENGVDIYVPALGVLEQVDKLIAKSGNGTMTPAEFAILQNQNLALLSSYEHAKALSIDLAEKWLVKYKFRDWSTHRSDPNKKGKSVTEQEKKERANEIVTKLANHALWHSHGRFLGPTMLRDELRLEIDDYPKTEKTDILIRNFNDLLTDYIEQQKHLYYMYDKRKVAEG